MKLTQLFGVTLMFIALGGTIATNPPDDPDDWLTRSFMIDMMKEKPHQCSICSRAFKHSPNLKRHKATVHSKERPFSCQICGRVYNRKDNLNTHTLMCQTISTRNRDKEK